MRNYGTSTSIGNFLVVVGSVFAIHPVPAVVKEAVYCCHLVLLGLGDRSGILLFQWQCEHYKLYLLYNCASSTKHYILESSCKASEEVHFCGVINSLKVKVHSYRLEAAFPCIPIGGQQLHSSIMKCCIYNMKNIAVCILLLRQNVDKSSFGEKGMF